MGTDRARSATWEASPNIALVKYWGIRDPALNLPYNSSISLTLRRLRTRTTVELAPEGADDRLILNGVSAEGRPLESVRRFLDRIRERAGDRRPAVVRSHNNFPTASGLASSASGFAALAAAAAEAYGLTVSRRELSRLARLGSGSASRSIFGGFVEWRRGDRRDGRDSYARPLFDERYWPAFRDLVVVVGDAREKSVRSQDAMQATVRTSPEFDRRQRELPGRLAKIRAALRRRDPDELFPLIMEECDSFRTVCETTVPSLDYLSRTSRAVLDEVRALNAEAGRPIAAYTHDAGAHLHVFTLAKDARTVRARLRGVPGVRRTWLLEAGPGVRPTHARVP